MRRTFASLIHKEMSTNKDIYVVTADLGYKMWDQVQEDYPDRFINVGSAEQLMMGVCIGLCESGKRPIAYSITPFLLCRPFEFIRNYIDHEKIPVKLVGSGRDDDYKHDGFSHYAGDDVELISAFKNIEIMGPETPIHLQEHFDEFLYNGKPTYLNLKR